MSVSESIIIHRQPLGEADLLITFFSRNEGKLKGVAKSARKSKKRFGGVLETGYITELEYSAGKSDLFSIKDAMLVEPRTGAPRTLPESAAMWTSLEMATRLLADADESKPKYDLLRRFLIAIYEKRLTRQVLIYFLMKWMDLSGFMPDTNQISKETTYKFRDGSIEPLISIVAGDMNCGIKDRNFEDLLKFLFYYIKLIGGKPLRTEGYLPVLMEL